MSAGLALALTTAPAAASGTGLADRIAEALCYSPGTTVLPLSPAEAAAYAATPRMTGAYRDIQGPDARAWFRKDASDAVCRMPADFGLTLFFCGAVNRDGTDLVEAPVRLCP